MGRRPFLEYLASPRFVCAIIMGAVLIFALRIPAMAAEIDGVEITKADVTQLLSALHVALKPNDMTIPLVVSLKQPSDMPVYSRQW